MKKIIGITLIVVCILLAGFCGLQMHSYQKVKDTYAEGLIYFQEKDYEKSAEIFDKGSSINSFFAQSMKTEMLGYQAESYFNLGNYEEAIKIYDDLIQKRPDSIIYYMMKGNCYQKSGNIQKAKDTFQAGWDKTKDTSFLKQLCNISIEEGDLKSAISYIDIGLKEEGDAKKAFLFDKIVVYEKSQDYENAWKVAQEFHNQYPDDENGQKEYTFLSTRIQ